MSKNQIHRYVVNEKTGWVDTAHSGVFLSTTETSAAWLIAKHTSLISHTGKDTTLLPDSIINLIHDVQKYYYRLMSSDGQELDYFFSSSPIATLGDFEPA